MARTFLTKYVQLVKQLCKYTTKYQTVIIPLLDEPEKSIFLALVASCNALLQSTIPEKARMD